MLDLVGVARVDRDAEVDAVGAERAATGDVEAEHRRGLLRAVHPHGVAAGEDAVVGDGRGGDGGRGEDQAGEPRGSPRWRGFTRAAPG